MFKRRIGPDIHIDENGDPTETAAAASCPDIWELEDGNIAVIGIRKTAAFISNLPAGAGCGPDEEIVVLPRSLLLRAKNDIMGL
jgi:hypothetical protein